MNEKLLIGLLGKSGSGRSYMWSQLFGKRVITGKNTRKLFLNETEYVDVFLINGSPGERHIAVEKILPEDTPNIVLASLEYRKGVRQTINYFLGKSFVVYLQWLNPGYKQQKNSSLFYTIGIVNYLLSAGAVVCVRDSNGNTDKRVQEIKDYIYGWAKSREIIKIDQKRLKKQNQADLF